MSIDEAINRLRNYEIINSMREKEQLAEWLEELKNNRIALEKANGYLEVNHKLGYSKAIDDFVREFKRKTPMENCLIDELAEQLKAGESNDD